LSECLKTKLNNTDKLEVQMVQLKAIKGPAVVQRGDLYQTRFQRRSK
jgi:hypothetical protein